MHSQKVSPLRKPSGGIIKFKCPVHKRLSTRELVCCWLVDMARTSRPPVQGFRNLTGAYQCHSTVTRACSSAAAAATTSRTLCVILAKGRKIFDNVLCYENFQNLINNRQKMKHHWQNLEKILLFNQIQRAASIFQTALSARLLQFLPSESIWGRRFGRGFTHCKRINWIFTPLHKCVPVSLALIFTGQTLHSN